MQAPISRFEDRRVNASLHGRSVYRPWDVPSHNVFRGYKEWDSNGHHGIGDAVDLFADRQTPVIACFSGTMTRHYNDATKLEVVYLEGEDCVAVYAHIEAVSNTVGKHFDQGDVIGWVRGDLADPHLHFELWRDGEAVAAETPGQLRAAMARVFHALPFLVVDAATDQVVFPPKGQTWAVVPNGDHLDDQGKVYARQNG